MLENKTVLVRCLIGISVSTLQRSWFISNAFDVAGLSCLHSIKSHFIKIPDEVRENLKHNDDVGWYLMVYGCIAASNSVFTLLRSFLFAYGGIKAARVLHSALLNGILQVKMLLNNFEMWFSYLNLDWGLMGRTPTASNKNVRNRSCLTWAKQWTLWVIWISCAQNTS